MDSTTKRWIFGVLVSSSLIYSAFVYTVGTAHPHGEELISEQTRSGKALFQKHNCISCHQIYGLGGYLGPDLTNVVSNPIKGPAYARAILQSGTQRMPNFQLSDQELDDLVAFLGYVDKTGISPVTNFSINPNGTVSQH